MIAAPSYPYHAPAGLKVGVGVLDPSDGAWCFDCVPLALYYLGAGTRLPSGWRMLRQAQATRAHRCARCDERLR